MGFIVFRNPMRRSWPARGRVRHCLQLRSGGTMKRAIVILTAAAVVAVLAGCGTTTRSGQVGDTVSGGGLRVTVERVDLHPPIPAGDVTGLSRPRPGDRLIAARVGVCNKYGFAVGKYDFGISLLGGGDGLAHYAQTNYADGFQDVENGCARGWIVFELPLGHAIEDPLRI
jgi:hypothetical protein